MRAHLLGTGGYHPNDRRHTACVMLPELGIVLDAGTSFFRVAPLIETPTLDIYLTHAHLDHIFGLTCALVPMLKGEIEHVRLHGETETLNAVRTHLFAEPVFPLLPKFEFCELTNGQEIPGAGQLHLREQEHPGGSLGFRLDWACGSLVYMTDLFQDGSAEDFVRDADLLLHECNFRDGQEEWAKLTGHSTPTPVARMAKAAGVGQLVLIHHDPNIAEEPPIPIEPVRNIFPESEIGVDGMILEFGADQDR